VSHSKVVYEFEVRRTQSAKLILGCTGSAADFTYDYGSRKTLP